MKNKILYILIAILALVSIIAICVHFKNEEAVISHHAVDSRLLTNISNKT